MATKIAMYPRNTETVFKKPIIVAGERGLVAHIDNGRVTLCDRFGVPYPQADLDMVKTYTGMSKTSSCRLRRKDTCSSDAS